MRVNIVLDEHGEQSYLLHVETSAVPEKGERLNILKECWDSTGCSSNKAYFNLIVKERTWSNRSNGDLFCTLIVE